MATIRVAKRRRFTTIARPTLNDERLSFRARGVLVWLLDKPDDWRADSNSIASGGTEGRDAIRKCLTELETYGYLVRTRSQNDRGHWSTESVIYEQPTDNVAATDDAFSGVGAPVVGAPAVGAPGVGGPGPKPLVTVTDDGTETPCGADAPAALFEAPSAPAKGKKAAKPLEGNALIADELARAEWERRTIKPVCGFPALRSRIGEALEAGYPREQVAAALPSMSVFSRNSFDMALGQRAPTGGRRPVDDDRSARSGSVPL